MGQVGLVGLAGRARIGVTCQANPAYLAEKFTGDAKEDTFHHTERRYGSFSRSFSLPRTVDAGKVSAEYKNGVLSVRLPLREEAKPRQIKVDVAA